MVIPAVTEIRRHGAARPGPGESNGSYGTPRTISVWPGHDPVQTIDAGPRPAGTPRPN